MCNELSQHFLVGLDGLKAAIVKQAAEDYVDIKAGFVRETPGCNLEEIEKFFYSDRYDWLCEIDLDCLINKLERKIQNMMLKYTIAKEKGSSKYYVHEVNNPSPVPGTHGTKKEALHIAAELNGVTYKDYMRIRRQSNSKNLED